MQMRLTVSLEARSSFNGIPRPLPYFQTTLGVGDPFTPHEAALFHFTTAHGDSRSGGSAAVTSDEVRAT